MEFIVKSSDLVKELRKSIKGFDPKEDSSFIEFELDRAGKLIITARSRSAFFEGSLPATNINVDANETMKYYVDGITLRNLAGIFPASPIDVKFSIDDNTRQFKITYAGSQFKLGVNGDYSSQVKPVTTNIADIAASDLMPALRDLLKITDSSAEAQEHQASCIDLKFDEDVLTLMATDTFAFAEIKLPYSNSELENEKRVLIKQSEIALLMGMFSPSEVLTITTADGMFGYYDEDGSLALVSLTTLQPLDYKRIIESVGTENSIAIEKDEFKYAIDTIAKLTDDNIINLEVNSDRNTLKVSNVLGNMIEVPIETKILNENFDKKIAIHVMLESLAPANTGKIRLQWGNSPQLIQTVPVLDNGSDLESVIICSALYA